VLNLGVGTGRDQAHLQAAVGPGGLACGLDISGVMVKLTRARTGAPLCLADGRQVPLADGGLDRLSSAPRR
jgi:ubiquinone/menaquinone biosynthesis C-methylase UbiE